ncbi:KR domain-containing protein, partial [Exilibacterium tricleocarpae]
GVEARAWLPSLVRGSDAGASLSEAVAGYYAAGGQPDWAAYYAGRGCQRISVPTYPFQGKKHWLKGHTVEAELAPADVVADWFYRVDWQPQAAHAERAVQGRWLVLCDCGGIAAHGVDALGQQGLVADCVMAGGDIDPTQPAAFERLLAERPPYAGIVYAWALDCTANDQLDGERLQADEALSCGGLLHLVQALLQRPAAREASAPLYIVTRDAQGVEAGAAVSVSQAPVVGMAKVIATEHPELHSVSVDLAGGSVEAAGEQLGWSLCRRLPGDCVALRGESVLVPSMQKLASDPDAKPVLIKSTGCYLITGGTGALGMAVAQWLIEQGAESIVLIARTDILDPSLDTLSKAQLTARDQINTWIAEGIDISVGVVDLQDSAAQALLDKWVADRPIRGVFHLAGSNRPTAVAAMNLAGFRAVSAAKMLGCWRLHQALTTAGVHQLELFVVFSSIAAVWGAAGMAHYAAANECANALVDWRRSKKLCGHAIQWGPWGDAGMAAGHYAEKAESMGLNPISMAKGIQALEHILAHNPGRSIALSVDWSKFIPVFDPHGARPLFRLLRAGEREGALTATPEQSETVAARIAAMDADAARNYVRAYLTAICVELLEMDSQAQIKGDAPLREAGIDSILAIHLKGILEKQFSKKIAATIVFDCPTINEMSEFLISGLVDESDQSDAPAPPSFMEALAKVEKMNETEVENVLSGN